MKKALLISHDIGGFRPAFAYLSKTYRNLVCLVNGPALKEASQNFMNTINSFKEIELTEYDVYVSTGWASSFEKLHMKALQEHEVEWTGVLDNWTTYSERFVLDGVNYLPKQLMVFDEFALRYVAQLFLAFNASLYLTTLIWNLFALMKSYNFRLLLNRNLTYFFQTQFQSNMEKSLVIMSSIKLDIF